MSDDLLLRAAKDRIATALIGHDAALDRRIGTLTMRPHQAEAVVRLCTILARYRGALLADAVGLGKTYVALAIAARFRSPLIVCPAALRGMWERAMATADVRWPIQSTDGLGRGDSSPASPDLVIVDEAHHFRNPATRRYERLARMTRSARVLLLSATPLHNTRRDLLSVLALFLGSRVNGWSDEELSRVIVRRTETLAGTPLPAIIGPEALVPGDDEECLEAICALPLAVPAADEGAAAALTTISLVHLWSSSRAALLESLRNRRAKAVAMKDALAVGHVPTKQELAAWHYADGVQQLALPLMSANDEPLTSIAELDRRLDRYTEAVGALIARSHVSADPDQKRVELLRSIRVAHPHARIVAFSQYARTVLGLGKMLRHDPGIAVVHAEAAHIASGPISRQEVLDQFALDAPDRRLVERIDLLLTTDLLSEGVDLRGASVIVHLDLPWNPARVEQRVGRARRLGVKHRDIHVYTFVPPASAERLLRLRERLRGKIGLADSILGGAGPPEVEATTASPVARAEALRAGLAQWVDPSARSDVAEAIIASATGRCAGWIALVVLSGVPTLLHSFHGEISEGSAEGIEITGLIGPPRASDEATSRRARDEVERWLAARLSLSSLGIERAYSAIKRTVLDRLAATVARAPRHRRSQIIAAARRVRAGIAAVDGIGVERILADLAHSPVDDDAWIHSLETFEVLHAPSPGEPPKSSLRALIVIGPCGDGTISDAAVAADRP